MNNAGENRKLAESETLAQVERMNFAYDEPPKRLLEPSNISVNMIYDSGPNTGRIRHAENPGNDKGTKSC